MDISMISRLFFVSLIFVIGLIFQPSQAMEDEKKPFEKSAFQFTISPHHQDDISTLTLEQLIAEAKMRKEEFDFLFGYVCQHGLKSKEVNAIFDKELVLLEANTCVPRDLILLNRLKTDYTIERSLLDFYVQFLSTINKTKELSKTASEKLYQETVYIVRHGTHSLITSTRNALSKKSEEECFWEGDDFCVPYEFQPIDDESRLYYHFALTYRMVKIDEESPESISQMLSLLAQNSQKIQDPLVIFNYNSLVFYLKLERFLTMQYDDLVFDPTFYHFDSDISTQSQQFLLSALYKEKTEHWIGQIFDQSSRDRNKAIIMKYMNSNQCLTQSIKAEIPANKLVSIFLQEALPPQLQKSKAQKSKQVKGKSTLAKKTKAKEQVKHISLKLNEVPEERNIFKETLLIDKDEEKSPTEPLDVKLVEGPTEKSVETLAKGLVEVRKPFKTRNNWNLCDGKGMYEPYFSHCTAYRNKFTGGYGLQDQHLWENWSINKIEFCVSSRMSPNYSFQGQTFFETAPYFDKGRSTINESLLTDIKVYTGRTSDKLPNLGTGFITFHYINSNDIQCARTFDLEALYLSGNQFFHGEIGNQFKQEHAILNANQDFLEDEEKTTIYQKDSEIRGMYINLSLENKIRKEIIGGPYKYNAMDSESLLMLDLVKRLPQFLMILIEENPSKDIQINGLFLGISSYRDCCGGCISVIHGFQHASKDILSKIIHTYFEKDNIHIHPDYGTLAITYGQIRVAKGKGVEEPRKVLDTLSWLKRKEHHLARIRF